MSLTWEDFEKMYRDEHGHIPQFDYIVKKDLGILGNPKANALMSYAWQEGHSSGYYSVYQIASELVDLITYTNSNFKVVDVNGLKHEIEMFVNNPNDVLNCIDRYVNKETSVGE